VNSFAFSNNDVDVDEAALVAMQTALGDFYNGVDSGSSRSLAMFISPAISRTIAPTMKTYNLDGNLDGTAHGSPIDERSLPLLSDPTSGQIALPSEVAVAITWRANYGADAEFSPNSRPRARDRGRVFIGPLNAGMITGDPLTAAASMAATTMGTFGHAGARLMNASGPDLVVWSRKNAGVKLVTSVQVDNAFDTQRRRGEKASSRLTYTI
jgi:hypothetical protein